MATPQARGSTLKAAISAELIYGNPASTGINLSVIHAFRDLYGAAHAGISPVIGASRHRYATDAPGAGDRPSRQHRPPAFRILGDQPKNGGATAVKSRPARDAGIAL